jgi:methylase of polypeptide subunit release factors
MDTNTLESIASRLSALHRSLRLRPVLETAREAGLLLLAAKARVARGYWLQWVRDCTPLSPRVAQIYMQVASSNAKATSSTSSVTIEQFLAIIRLPPPRAEHPAYRHPDADCRVYVSDCRSFSWPKRALVIATDPPWADDLAYEWPAGFSAERLVEGGLLFCQCGVSHLARRLRQFEDVGLSYVWTLAIVYRTVCSVPVRFGLCNSWRPVLLFSRGKTGRLQACSDTYTIQGHRKTAHPWEQPLDPWRHWVGKLTPEDCTVLDPFCGSGTIGVACKLTGRHYLGTDTDRRSVLAARRRIVRGE